MANTTTTFVRVINSVEINQVGVVTSTFNMGARGLSAYEQAVAGGYEGTLSQFYLDMSSISNKVDKVAGKGLSTEDYTTSEKSKVANMPLNTNTELAAKVDKVAGSSLVPDTEIDKLAEYPEFEDLEFSHDNLTDKNSEAAFQHLDASIEKENPIAADSVGVWDSVVGRFILTKISDFKTSLAIEPTPTTIVLNKSVLNGIVDPQIFKWSTDKTVSSVLLTSNCSEISVTIGSTTYDHITLVGVTLSAGTEMIINDITIQTGFDNANALIIF